METKRTRTLLDFDGNVIGYCKIELLRNKLKLYKKNSNVNFDTKLIQDTNAFSLIYYDGDNYSAIIGKVVYYIQSSIPQPTPDILECNYSCNPFKHEPSELNYTIDINCINTYFNINMEINRQRLFKKLLENKFIAEYKPEKYSGVKMLYKHNQTSTCGICMCSSKCTCNNITFLIFQSGNLIVTGFKRVEEINLILGNFKDFLISIQDSIKKRVM
jgi:hypothetical protein